MRTREAEVDVDEDPFNEKPSLVWRLIAGVFKLMMVLVLLLVVGLCFAYYTSQQQPDFYAAAMKADPERSKELGSGLETSVLDLYNAALIPTTWQGELSEAGINGWLATELPEKFPELLPENVKDPRVSLAENQLTIACRCSYKDLQGMLVGNFDLFCTDVPNQVAVRIGSVKMGIVPFPVTQFADQITELLMDAGYESAWTETDGEPVLLIDVPQEHLVIEDYYRIQVQSFDIKDKKILFTGETVELSADDRSQGQSKSESRSEAGGEVDLDPIAVP